MYIFLLLGKYSVAVVLMPSVSVVFQMIVLSTDCPMMEMFEPLKVDLPCSSPVTLVMLYSPLGTKSMNRLDSVAPEEDALAIAALKSPSTPSTKSNPCFAIAEALAAIASGIQTANL